MNRRTVIGALAAAPLAMSTTPAIADPSGVGALIDAHRAAWSAFEAAVDALGIVQDSYDATHRKPFFIPCLLGGGCDSQLSLKEVKKFIAGAFEHHRRSCVGLARIAPEEAKRIAAILDEKEVENFAIVDECFAAEEKRRDDFGLAAAEREWKRANAAEEEALLALCAFPCGTIEAAREKAAYLATTSSFTDCVPDARLQAALIRSFLPAED